ncbi:MAG: 3-oxoacyl-ACP synthase [Crocinitomicaceae bacterium]|nr:3-oxoacyl-ACP synthase [Crocinitomicaceae bacterium]
MNDKELKELFLAELYSLVGEKLNSASSAIDATTESKNTATKSTAGDKHETGRAMMERELALSTAQLHKAQFLKNELSKISLDIDFTSVQLGALVVTNQGNYFISIGLGKVNVLGDDCYAISGGSPLGIAMMGKQKGQMINFQGRNIEIIDVV